MADSGPRVHAPGMEDLILTQPEAFRGDAIPERADICFPRPPPGTCYRPNAFFASRLALVQTVFPRPIQGAQYTSLRHAVR